MRSLPPKTIPFSLFRLYGWAARIVRPVWWLFLASAAGDLINNYAVLFQGVLFGAVVTIVTALSHGNSHPDLPYTWMNFLIPTKLAMAASLLLAIVIFGAVFSYVIQGLTALTDGRMLNWLQLTIHDRMLSLGTDWYDRREHNIGASTYTLNIATRGAQPALSHAMKYPFVEAVTAGGGLVAIFQSMASLPDTPLLIRLLAVGLLLVVPFPIWWLSNSVRRANDELMAAEQNVTNEALNSLSQPLPIQSIGGVQQRSKSMKERLDIALTARIRVALRSNAVGRLAATYPDLFKALFLAYGVILIAVAPKNDPTSLAAALGAVVLLYNIVPDAIQRINAVIEFFGGLNGQWPLIASVGEVLDASPVAEPVNPRAWPDGEQRIALDKLRFSYRPDLPLLLDGIDYQFIPGSITAITGGSGSGKTTIFQLLTRLRRPTGGDIRVADESFYSIALPDLRSHIAIVHQAPPFLTDTIRANFQLAAANASDAEIEAACRQVAIWDTLVAKSPLTPLDQQMSREPGGADDFAGGERRRIAIARGLLRRPSVLLLDEPTVGIDALNLELAKDAIKRAAKGITVIMIEQNLDFILGVAHQVCVLDKGRFVQTGDPCRLAEAPGKFRELIEAKRRVTSDDRLTITPYAMPSIEPPTQPDGVGVVAMMSVSSAARHS
jgi:ABC-type multidrug transport system fused ATPase/permease subunit